MTLLRTLLILLAAIGLAMPQAPKKGADKKAAAAAVADLIDAGSRGRHEADLVPWSEVPQQINTLFEGDGLSDGDQVSAVESVLRKMLENEDLRAQAKANNKTDFFYGPDLWNTVQEIIVDTGDAQQKGIERLAADRSPRHTRNPRDDATLGNPPRGRRLTRR